MKTLCIIPCAGLGTRMSMTLNKSKELLIDPCTHEPIIKWSLDLCKKHHIEPLVITRKEKTDLIAYLSEQGVKCLIIEPDGSEWPSTVLASEHLWQENNILILPDTRFSPENALKQIEDSLLLQKPVTFALHSVDNVSKWGCVEEFYYCEKPNKNTHGWAWGLIGFKKDFGPLLLNNMLEQQIFHDHIEETNFLFLDKFVDLTRTGKIEKWK